MQLRAGRRHTVLAVPASAMGFLGWLGAARVLSVRERVHFQTDWRVDIRHAVKKSTYGFTVHTWACRTIRSLSLLTLVDLLVRSA